MKKPMMYTWIYYDNIRGEINFQVGDKRYKYIFIENVRYIMNKIRTLYYSKHHQEYRALNMAKKCADKVEHI